MLERPQHDVSISQSEECAMLIIRDLQSNSSEGVHQAGVSEALRGGGTPQDNVHGTPHIVLHPEVDIGWH